MGNNEEGKSFKSEKPSSPARLDQTNQTSQPNIHHVYPDWAAMQAYYGQRVTIPPYYNSTVASGHAPHPYMWGPPQPMMSPYGAPYAAMYPHGGVYAHPAVPLGSHSHGQGVPLSPAPLTPMSIATPTKSGNTDRGLMKKLKEFDGLAMSIGNGTAERTEGGAEHRLSQRFVELFLVPPICSPVIFFRLWYSLCARKTLHLVPCKCVHMHDFFLVYLLW
jgi:plant G-box-binding factor